VFAVGQVTMDGLVKNHVDVLPPFGAACSAERHG